MCGACPPAHRVLRRSSPCCDSCVTPPDKRRWVLATRRPTSRRHRSRHCAVRKALRHSMRWAHLPTAWRAARRRQTRPRRRRCRDTSRSRCTTASRSRLTNAKAAWRSAMKAMLSGACSTWAAEMPGNAPAPRSRSRASIAHRATCVRRSAARWTRRAPSCSRASRSRTFQPTCAIACTCVARPCGTASPSITRGAARRRRWRPPVP